MGYILVWVENESCNIVLTAHFFHIRKEQRDQEGRRKEKGKKIFLPVVKVVATGKLQKYFD